MNQLLINGKMSQGFGLKMKRKQQVEYKGIVSEVLEAGRVSGCVYVRVSWLTESIRNMHKHLRLERRGVAGFSSGCKTF